MTIEAIKSGFTLRLLKCTEYPQYDLVYKSGNRVQYSNDTYESERQGREALAQAAPAQVETEGWDFFMSSVENIGLWEEVAHKW